MEYQTEKAENKGEEIRFFLFRYEMRMKIIFFYILKIIEILQEYFESTSGLKHKFLKFRGWKLNKIYFLSISQGQEESNSIKEVSGKRSVITFLPPLSYRYLLDPSFSLSL